MQAGINNKLCRDRGPEPCTLKLWVLFDLKHEVWQGGPKFDTDVCGLKPKATGLHLVGVTGDILQRLLAPTASWP